MKDSNSSPKLPEIEALEDQKFDEYVEMLKKESLRERDIKSTTKLLHREGS